MGVRGKQTTEREDTMTPADLLTLRRRLGLSQAVLAVRLGVDKSTIWRYEAGHSRIPASVGMLMEA